MWREKIAMFLIFVFQFRALLSFGKATSFGHTLKIFWEISKCEKSSAFVTILVKEEEENMADKEKESLILNLHKYLLLTFIQGT